MIDSLLNFETVKYFGNEEMEARRFDVSMAKYEKAAIKTYYSLGILNSGQAIIFTVGMTLCMLLAARGVATGVHTVGDSGVHDGLLQIADLNGDRVKEHFGLHVKAVLFQPISQT